LPYSPVYALWSDGANKRRWLWLPPGTHIDGSDPDAWRFPIGTRLWKEFAFDRPIETRLLEQVAIGRWRFATYVWTADGADAVLAPGQGVRGAFRDDERCFDIPSRLDCVACHLNGTGPVLGLGGLQLSRDRDPLAPHAETPAEGAVDAAELQRRGLLRGAPDVAARIPAVGPRERAALGYLHANCGHCHNDRGALRNLGLVLQHRFDHPASAAIATTCEQPSRFCPTGQPAGTALRVRPGHPEDSVLLRRASSRHPFLQMPPLGTSMVDRAALELLAGWIREDLSQRPSTMRPVR
ncbi:MAG: hypothetical protein KAI24_22815, partial [Planctomycetes bacterium]|nr:hypothetical protein [Planctomycetota bacterium]